MKGVCQRIEGKAERVDPSLRHPPEDGSIKQIFTQDPGGPEKDLRGEAHERRI